MKHYTRASYPQGNDRTRQPPAENTPEESQTAPERNCQRHRLPSPPGTGQITDAVLGRLLVDTETP